MQERLKQKNAAAAKKPANGSTNGNGTAGGKDGKQLTQLQQEEELSLDDENEIPNGMNNKFRFDTLIKTMIARIEYNNTLAPV